MSETTPRTPDSGQQPNAALDACAIWPDCGYRHTDRRDPRRVRVTEDFLRHFYQRPELLPMETSCDVERSLHAKLLENPFRPVTNAELAKLEDTDAIENYRFALDFRELLVTHNDLESAYMALVSDAKDQGPAAGFMANLLTQLIVLHLLANQHDPYLFRAAELFFRPQKVSIEHGLLLADAATLARRREPGAVTVLQLLIDEARGEPPTAQDGIESLNDSTAHSYADRNQRFDLGLDLVLSGPGMRGLCRVIELWLYHFFDVHAQVEAIRSIEERHWTWHIGMDADSNQILNALYRGETVPEEALARLVCLFELQFDEPHFLATAMIGKVIYLGLAMDRDQNLHMKPQNLLVNLPLAGTT